MPADPARGREPAGLRRGVRAGRRDRARRGGAPRSRAPPRADPGQASLFAAPAAAPAPAGPDVAALVRELEAQLRAVAGSPRSHRLNLLLAAESQGGLIAAEMHHEGLPWNRGIHEQLLEQMLGPRPEEGRRPARMQSLAEHVGRVLGSERLNPDSPQDLLRALNSAGVRVGTTRKWDLMAWAAQGGAQTEERRELIRPVLEYKQLYRLWTANGWHWLDEWIREDRFHAAYVVGGVVTGRWAAHGGGAMQIPKTVRDAVRAEPGHVLTVADASQVEPRILAAMSGDRALAVAGRGHDLYLGIAEIGQRTGSALKDRQAAKIALLGAMYGATSGDAAAMMPHLRRLFPTAIELVERAAAAGERGGQVSTWLGRTSPVPDEAWFASVRDVGTAQAESRSRTLSRSHGRFTRNFVVQGTAAEWALCWMGEIRRRLRSGGADGAGMRTRMVFFVHDEVVLYGPEEEAEAVHGIVADAAEAAGRLLFGDAPVDFPLTVAAVGSYAEAK
ncbi:bifunctional 3'-5' exonuclease/DNA polymerase [Rothia sp. AR01]|uniref:DNA-directed DNA polymerase n=1 Tax=Rothia santali TaxID=2949643 RepID=A0A9X2HE17_9MICC|nr:bifunctional 3'-5' exonuclease/DNA polymerase [Rothia santali]MCP3425117.1 bifunctional 3'-5' exonuclease/DNA polymerase [Rothia santali]